MKSLDDYVNIINFDCSEQLKAEWDRKWEDQEVGAIFPTDVEIQLLTLNKCR